MDPAPSRLRESRGAQGRLTHARGPARAALIAGMPVVNVESGETVLLKEIDPLYSETWLRAQICSACPPERSEGSPAEGDSSLRSE